MMYKTAGTTLARQRTACPLYLLLLFVPGLTLLLLKFKL